MKAVIFAAGKGIRFGKITQTIPKPIIELHKRPLIEWVLSELPPDISEAFIVIGHLGNKIKEKLCNKFGAIKLTYIEQTLLTGTAGALWLCRKSLEDEKFLAINGDDIYSRADLQNIIRLPLAMGVYDMRPQNPKSLVVEFDEMNTFRGLRRPTPEEKSANFPIATGAYVLDKRIFAYSPVQLSNREYGLPQTLAAAVPDLAITAYKMNFWMQINSVSDLDYACRIFNLRQP